MDGILNPRTPRDIPLTVSPWIDPVAQVLGDIRNGRR